MEKVKGIIEPIEGNIVVEINGITKDFDKSIFPDEAITGDVVEIEGEGVSIIKNETEKLRREIEDLMYDVWED